MTIAAQNTCLISDVAKQRLIAGERRPLFVNDWLNAVFIHYRLDSRRLKSLVPFELDLFEGDAFISLVAFEMRRLRFDAGNRLINWTTAPIANHPFLNVRTYVRHGGEPGIFFLAEYLPNRLSLLLAPRAFGLPYRFGQLDYRIDASAAEMAGRVTAASGAALRFDVACDTPLVTAPCDADSRDAFLLERYTCFTERRGVRRRFRVWHPPWPQTVAAEVSVADDTLLRQTGGWLDDATLIGAAYSPGVRDVWVGRPLCIQGDGCATTWTAMHGLAHDGEVTR